MINVLQAISSGVIDNVSGNSNIGSQDPINTTTRHFNVSIDSNSLILGIAIGLIVAFICFGIYYFIKEFKKNITEDIKETIEETKNNKEEQE